MKVHNLKIHVSFLHAILTGHKTFEVRKNDRDFKVGDQFKLYAYDEGIDRVEKNYAFIGVITYITDFEQKDGYIVFAFDGVE